VRRALSSFSWANSNVDLVGGSLSNIDKVDATMNSVNEQRDIANEISEAISNTANLGLEIDEVRRIEGTCLSCDGAYGDSVG
jgi:hypothetical protein